MRIRELIPWRSAERGRNELRPTGHEPFSLFQTGMNRLFDEFFEEFDIGPWGKTAGVGDTLMPKVDVSETDDTVQVTAELPGLKQDEVEVTLADGSLVIRGEKKSEKENKTKTYHRIERSYGSFYRSIPLPAEIDDQKVDASFKDGVLNIVLPKSKTSNAGKRIAVQTRN